MTDLTAFLMARIEETEAAARAAQAHERALLEVKPSWSVVYAWAMMLNAPGGGGSHNFQPGAPSPARVLAQCAAYRAIVEIHVRHDWLPEGRDECAECGCADDRSVDWPCPTLRALASIYADHPGYEAGWGLS